MQAACFIGAKEYAEQTNRNISAVYGLIHGGGCPYVKIGKHYYLFFKSKKTRADNKGIAAYLVKKYGYIMSEEDFSNEFKISRQTFMSFVEGEGSPYFYWVAEEGWHAPTTEIGSFLEYGE